MITLKPIIKSNSWHCESMDSNKLLCAQNHRCFYCDGTFTANKRSGPLRISRDHLFPRWWGLGMGGNMVFAHAHCNSHKNGRTPTNEEVLKFFHLYRQNAPKRYWDRLVLSTRNNKPRFKLVITPELLRDYCK